MSGNNCGDGIRCSDDPVHRDRRSVRARGGEAQKSTVAEEITSTTEKPMPSMAFSTDGEASSRETFLSPS